MTINLHETGNPINRHERNKINENWQRITEGLNKLQRQIYILAGSQEVDEILERIDKAITDANNATTEVNSKIDEATNLINQLVDLINESQLIINNGNQLINDGTQLINTLTSLKADLVQLKSQLDDIANNEAERIANENTRIANEDERIINEQERVNAETQRNAAFNEQMQQISDVLPNVQGLENKGSWNATTQYYKNNIVERNGNSYQALKDNINQPPPTPPEKSNEFWGMIAQRGVDGTGAVSTVNGVSPDTEGNVELTAYDIDAIPISEKGVVGGVARLNEDGKVVDANGNEVEGKVKSVNGKTGDVQITSGDIHNIDPLPVTAYATAYQTGHSVMFIPANHEYSVGWRESLGLDTSINWYLIVEYFKTTSNNGYQKVTAYRLGSNLPNAIFMRNSTGSTSWNNWKRIFTSDDITDSTTTDDSTKVASAKAVKSVNDNLTQLQQTVNEHLADYESRLERKPFYCTALAGYKIASSNCFVVNNVAYVNLRVQKNDESAFDTVPQAVAQLPHAPKGTYAHLLANGLDYGGNEKDIKAPVKVSSWARDIAILPIDTGIINIYISGSFLI